VSTEPKVPVHQIPSGPALILAGPGTGKTHSLALRVKWLVEECKVDPDQITVITFTNEAALNMRHRLSDEEKKDVYMPRDTQPTQISTMHSLGLRIITSNHAAVGLVEGFKLVDSESLKRLIFGDAAQIAGFPRDQGKDAALLKSRGTLPAEEDELHKVVKTYTSIFRANNAIDFDDHILLATDLLVSSPTLLAEYQKRAKHLLVDEYQDINTAQFKFINLLAGEKAKGLFAVGDDDQSIYSFRGASPEFVRDFTKHYGKGCKTEQIALCRRCPPSVLKGALSLIEATNPGRLKKVDPEFCTEQDSPIMLLSSPTQEREAQEIAAACSRVTPSHDVLILVPSITFARPILTALRQRRVGYDCRSTLAEDGLLSLDTLGQWLTDPHDNFALRETLQYLIANARFGVPSIRARKPEKVDLRNRYLCEIASLWTAVIKNKCSLYDSLKVASKKSDFLASLLHALNELLKEHPKSSEEFFDVLRTTYMPWPTPPDMFQEIGAWIDELRGRGGTGSGAVRVLSMRLAKGLEADYVFVVGLEEGVFPHLPCTEAELQEAARLLFVSMTRAKIQLCLCQSRTRSAAATYLAQSYSLKPSPFLEAISSQYTKKKFIPPSAAQKAARGG
jgi:DNA helicase-2/ATP-dependent DNA helicase PcrA